MTCLTFLSKFLGRFFCFFYETCIEHTKKRGRQKFILTIEKRSCSRLDFPCLLKTIQKNITMFVFFQTIFILEKYFFYSIKMISHSVNSETFQLIELSSNSADSIFLQLPIFFYLEYNFQSDVFCPTLPTEIYTNKKIIHLVILS